MAARVIGEARRDSRVLAAYLDAHQELCARRRAEIAWWIGPDLAELWAVCSNRVRAGQLDALGGDPVQRGVARHRRKRLQGLVGDVAANALRPVWGAADQLASLGLLDGLEQLARGDRPGRPSMITMVTADRTSSSCRYLDPPRTHWIEAQLASGRTPLPTSGHVRRAGGPGVMRPGRAGAQAPGSALLLHRRLATEGPRSHGSRARPERGHALSVGTPGLRCCAPAS